jgi:hypothetical protein
VLPEAPMRQWVLSVPYLLRFLFASDSASLSESLGIGYRAIAVIQLKKAGLTQKNSVRCHHLDPTIWQCAQLQYLI